MRELKFKTTLSIEVIQIQNPFHWEPQILTQLGKIKLKNMKTINKIKTLTDKNWKREKEEKERGNLKPSERRGLSPESRNVLSEETEVTSGWRVTLEVTKSGDVMTDECWSFSRRRVRWVAVRRREDECH
jgi:hypothetical protein